MSWKPVRDWQGYNCNMERVSITLYQRDLKLNYKVCLTIGNDGPHTVMESPNYWDAYDLALGIFNRATSGNAKAKEFVL